MTKTGMDALYEGIRDLTEERDRLREENERLRAEVQSDIEHTAEWHLKWEQANARIKAALALHTPFNEENQRSACRQCALSWPCPTVKALRGEENSDG